MFRSPLFAWSPRPGQDQSQDPFGTPASQSPSRFGALQSNIRTMINGSSIYSQSPAPSHNNTPKVPFLGIFRRDSAEPNHIPTSHDAPRDSNDSRSPLQPQHTAGSYMRAIAPQQGVQAPETVYARHPADVPLPRTNTNGFVDPEIQQLADEINGRRHRRKHRRRKHRHHHHPDRWVRHRHGRQARGPMLFVRGSPARGKMIACIISGSFLLAVLAIYLAIALTNRDLGQEIHILFIMVLLTITIFFCHSLIRLCMLLLNPPTPQPPRPHIPDMTGPEGFQPIVPIRVHLARDAEADQDLERGVDVDADPEKEVIPPPPPAYGLWRSSVRVDPNLLHWQRANTALPTTTNNNDARTSIFSDLSYSRNGSVVGPAPPLPTTAQRQHDQSEGPRPPSYVSEDGVSYIVEAHPRSTAPRQSVLSHTGVSDIHPAWRPGYAVSEITVWPGGRR
ncbi:hypothetical protein FB567DRAFT_70093 [Paraphoma chrysanthemicola]|uniref:Uncharacterized protein n=1 Tax=Paraphoma chrysanthemicola TaxID=798071 RepID=A0A8K0R6H0_9PLEO|nr:hypothetical protein FB567DRAFT_70093 [Paraphoma chrysanthemicola]